MNLRLLAGLAGCLLLLTGITGQAAETNSPATELKDLVKNIQTKLREGKRTESDLTNELHQFDTLLAKYNDQKTDDVAQILYMKAALYEQVFNDTDKANALLQQLKHDFPQSKPVQMLQKQEEARKLRDSLVEGATFPDFSEKDVAGKPLSVANYKGKVVLLDFWATWCQPCVHELPNVIQSYEKHHPEGFEIIGISLDQDEQKLKTFTKQKNMTWQQYFDGQGWGNKLAVKYGVQSIPATFLLDGQGKIIGKDLRGEALEAAVVKALAKR